MKKPSKLSFKSETIRSLTGNELSLVAGGSRISIITNPGGPVETIGTSGTSVISRNPSGGLPSGGLPSGGLPSGH